jgi:pilus assembly protein Flp/PilA
MNALINRLLRDESGVTAIEYGLIAAGIGVTILTVVNTVGGSLKAIFTTVANDLSTAAR